MTARRISGAILAVLGALGVTASAYLEWHEGRAPVDMPLDRLFQTSVEGDATSYWTSMALPLALVAILAVIGAILLSRVVLAVGWLIGTAVWVLFVVMSALDEEVDLSIGDLDTGAWVALAGLVVMLVGLVAMGGPVREHAPGEVAPGPAPSGRETGRQRPEEPPAGEPSARERLARERETREPSARERLAGEPPGATHPPPEEPPDEERRL